MVKLVASSAFNVKSLTVPNSSSYSLFDLTTAQTLSVNGFVMGGPFDSTLSDEKITSLGFADENSDVFVTITKFSGLTETTIASVFTGTKAETGLRKLMSGADTVKLSNDADFANGFSGNDRILGQGGDDKLFGNGGDDILIGGTGDDLLNGGGGADRFVFNGRSGNDEIRGFQHGADIIQLRAADDIADLDITQSGKHVVITFETSEITIHNQDVADFSAADFLF